MRKWLPYEQVAGSAARGMCMRANAYTTSHLLTLQRPPPPTPCHTHSHCPPNLGYSILHLVPQSHLSSFVWLTPCPHTVSLLLQGGGAQKHSEAGDGRPVDRGVWTANTVKRPRQQPAHPQYANYWAPLTRKWHTMPHSAQSQHANYWAPRTRKRHQQEHRPQRPTESSDPTQHAKGRTGDRPGPRKGATTKRNVTQGGLFRWSL